MLNRSETNAQNDTRSPKGHTGNDGKKGFHKDSETPNGAADNRTDVEKHNKEQNANAPTTLAPVDGSNVEGNKKDPDSFKSHNDHVEAQKVGTKEAAVLLITSQTKFRWKDVGPWDVHTNPDKSQALRILKGVESFINDHVYGDWYWNTGIMVGTCFFAWFVARVGGGILSLGLVLLFTQSVYRAEMRRFNRNIRDDMTRINSSNRLENELETMEWLNSFMDKFWVIYMPALSETVLFQANEVMKDLAPGYGIEKLSLDEFTLGSKAPRVDSIKSYTRKGHDHIEMDWAFLFAPNDTDDMTKNEIKKKINPKVALGVTVGKAFISKSLPILVEDQTFKGRMNVKLKLNQNFPHVKTVAIQFLEAPTIDYSLKPVGGDTFGIDIMSFVPGLSKIVMSLIHGTLRPMLYAPNSLVIDVEEQLAAFTNDSIGCLAVTVKRCNRLKLGKKTKPNSLNPYVQLKVENNDKISETTKIKKSVNDPIFMETKYLLINQLEGNHLNLNVFNLIADKPDDQLVGNVQFPLVDLLQEDTHLGVVKNVTESGKVVGSIEFDIRWFPALEPKVLEDGTKQAITDTEVGIVKLNLHEARDLDLSHSALGLLNPYAEIYINNELIKNCRQLVQTNEPSWEQSLELLITEQSKTTIQILVKDSANDLIVGKLNSNLQDLIFETSRGQQWVKLISGKPDAAMPNFRITANWKALGMHDEKVGLFTEAPIGGLRVHIRSCSDLVNLESVGLVDPYIRCIMDGNLRAKTNTIADTLDPHFNNVYYFPIANEHQHVLLQIMDEEPEGNDRSLGTCAINAYDFVKKNTEGYYLGYDGSNEILEQPVLYNGDQHGYLHYSVSFIPTLPVYTKEQLDNMDKYEALIQEKKEAERKKYLEDEKLLKEHPSEYEWIDLDDQDTLPEPPKQEIPLETAIKYRSGNISVTLFSARLSKPDLLVHTLFDDQAYPSGVSSKAEGNILKVKSRCESFIRDLPNSRLTFRTGKKAEISHEKEIVLEKTFDTIDILKKSYEKPVKLKLGDKDELRVQLEYFPSAVKLAPTDTVLDVGMMKLELLGADGLPSVDSNGKSDPLCVVKLDGVEIYKTDKKRRTLDPVWNEAVEFPVQSKSRQLIMLEVYDWDLTHDNRLLGRVLLDLSELEPLESTQFKVSLDTEGKVSLRATFRPEYIRPKLDSTSGLQIDLNDVGAAPMKAVGGVAGIATNVVGDGAGFAADTVTKGGSFIKHFGRGKKNKDDDPGKTEKAGDGSAKETGHKEEKNNETSIDDLASQPSEHNGEASSSRQSSKSKHGDAPDLDDVPSLRSGPPPIVHAAPNVDPELLPPAQKPNIIHHGMGHSRSSSNYTERTFIGSSDGVFPGRVTVNSASGYSGACDVKVLLQSGEKEKGLLKTRSAKGDKNDVIHWNESIPFKSSEDASIIFVVREKRTFGKATELGRATVKLSDVALNPHLDLQVGNVALLKVSIDYRNRD